MADLSYFDRLLLDIARDKGTVDFSDVADYMDSEKMIRHAEWLEKEGLLRLDPQEGYYEPVKEKQDG